VPAPSRHHAPVLVIGSGAAGLRAALAAREAGQDVVVVGKSIRRDAHTVLAAGGINAVLGTRDPEDTWQQHFADTYVESYSLADPRTVELMVTEAPRAVTELAEWGTPFARTEDGRIDQRFFGAHRYRRTCYVGDSTGRAVLYTLADRVDATGIPVHDHRYVTRLLLEDGRCVGALAFDVRTGERTAYTADAVVLATGGHTRLWRRSSSRADENTGDGMSLALAAGVELADMELVQFHPTGMVAPEDMVGTLVTEAVRGEGGHLLNAAGERYMHRYDAERMELSTRDRVALANYTEIVEGRGGPNGGVLLDISHRSREHILRRLPRMYRQFMDAQGLDITEQPMEVAPTAHYSMGGVVVTPDTHATSVPGLYATGEVTSGLHGANRLGGNSLAETVVFGRRAGEAAADFAERQGGGERGHPGGVVSEATLREADDSLGALLRPGSEDVTALSDALRDLMWRHGGVVRDEARLVAGLDRLSDLRAAAEDVDVRPERSGHRVLARVLDLRAALDTAEATLLGALERRESRGAHQRSDHPDLDPALTVTLVVSCRDGKQVVSRRPVEPVRTELAVHLRDGDLPVAGRLLE
jgi:succinate dehydrogenase / fumarate reductase flavoprotein subunit